MDNNKKMLIRQMIYDKSKDEILEELDMLDDAEMLYVFAYNYNWDNGFLIPEKILDKECCELSTALMMFYSADGIRYLKNKNEGSKDLKEWYGFIEDLYVRIVNNKFIKGNIKFVPPLSKVELYKLKKNLGHDEIVFMEVFGEKELNLVI